MECASLPEPAFRSQPDERLVALTRSGQPRAFEEIVRRYRPSLVRFAGRFVSDGRAEDVVQEALVRSHRALLGGDSEIHLRSWLYRIVHNGAISDLRATRSHDELDETIDGVPQPPDIFERREELRGVVKQLKALPASQRQALVASELEGASHDQIASALGTTPGGVSQLIFRARTALRSAGAWLFPLPLLRLIPKLSGASAGGGGSAGAGGAVAAVTGSAGAKLGSTMAAAVLLVGSGAALKGERAPASKDDGTGARHERAESSAGEATASPDHQPLSASASPATTAIAADSGHSGSADSPAAGGSSDAVREGSVSGGGEAGADDAHEDSSSTSTPADDSPNAEQPPPSGPRHESAPPPSGTQPPPDGSYSGGYRSGPESGTLDGYTRPPRMYASGDTYTAPPPPPPPDGDTSLDGSQPPPPDGSGDGYNH